MGDFYRQVHRQYLDVKHVRTAESLNTTDEAENEDCCEYQQPKLRPKRAKKSTEAKESKIKTLPY